MLLGGNACAGPAAAWRGRAVARLHRYPGSCCCPSVTTTSNLLPSLPWQSKVVQHICRFSEAYLQLLLPHAADGRVAALLAMLAACGCEDGALPSGEEAESYLRLLTAIVQQLGSCTPGAAGKGGSLDSRSGNGSLAGTGTAAPHAAAAVPERLAGLLAAAFSSIVSATALIESEMRQQLTRAFLASSSGARLAAQPQRLHSKVEAQVRWAMFSLRSWWAGNELPCALQTCREMLFVVTSCQPTHPPAAGAACRLTTSVQP